MRVAAYTVAACVKQEGFFFTPHRTAHKQSRQMSTVLRHSLFQHWAVCKPSQRAPSVAQERTQGTDRDRQQCVKGRSARLHKPRKVSVLAMSLSLNASSSLVRQAGQHLSQRRSPSSRAVQPAARLSSSQRSHSPADQANHVRRRRVQVAAEKPSGGVGPSKDQPKVLDMPAHWLHADGADSIFLSPRSCCSGCPKSADAATRYPQRLHHLSRWRVSLWTRRLPRQRPLRTCLCGFAARGSASWCGAPPSALCVCSCPRLTSVPGGGTAQSAVALSQAAKEPQDLPFGLYLLFSSFVAIAAVRSWPYATFRHTPNVTYAISLLSRAGTA